MNILLCKQRIAPSIVIALLYLLCGAGETFAFVHTSIYRERYDMGLLRTYYDPLLHMKELSHRIAVYDRSLEMTPTKLHSTSVKFKNFDVMLNSLRDEPTLVYFSSNVCGSCKLQKKELVNIRHRLFGSTIQQVMTTTTLNKKILTIDADEFPQVCLRYGIAKLPCILLINNGKVLLRLDGFTTADDLIERIQSTITTNL